METDEKYEKLRSTIRELGSVAVAYSGGVDSTLLCKVAHDELGDLAIAITVLSPMLPEREREDAKTMAEAIGIRHLLIPSEQLDAEVAKNTAGRCYACKKVEFARIKAVAAENGINAVLDGSNKDDLADYRPGLNAIRELGIVSPLRLAELAKADIREISFRLKLATWDKPAFACLASRVPYGDQITIEKLRTIEKAEECLHGLGLRQFRVRHHGEIARIEVAPDERTRLFDTELLDGISEQLRSLGFLYVCMELAGYRTGSLNRALPIEMAKSAAKNGGKAGG